MEKIKEGPEKSIGTLKEQFAEKEKRIRELEKLVEKLKSDLRHDTLTGLKTRGHFTEEMKKNVSTIDNPGSEQRKEGFHNISFLFCDIDNFKKINDTYGHNFGDEILKEVSRILQENVRDADMVCRWGGEEMVVGLMGAKEEDALKIAEEIRKAVEDKISQKYSNHPNYAGFRTSLSIGGASFEPGLNFEQLVKRADDAMYLAKKEGKNRVKSFSQVEEKEKEN